MTTGLGIVLAGVLIALGIAYLWPRLVNTRRRRALAYVALALAAAVVVSRLEDVRRNGQREDRTQRDALRGQQRAIAEQARDTAQRIVAAQDAVNLTNCRSGNRTRKTLRLIVRRSEAALAQYVADGTITPAQARRARDQSEAAIRDLHDRDCDTVRLR